MNLDLITSIEVTASAGIGVATAALLLGRTPRIRFSITAVLVLWFVFVTFLAASPFFSPQNRLVLPVMGLSVMLPIVAFVFAVRRSTALKEGLRSASLTSLVALNIVRVLGVSFLLLKASGRVSPTFASIAGWGDVIVGVLAIPLTWALATRRTGAQTFIWFWNTFGLLDLAAAVTLGVITSPGPLRLIVEPGSSAIMTTLPWFLIPGFLVPLLASSHLAIFWRLAQSVNRRRSTDQLRDTTFAEAS